MRDLSPFSPRTSGDPEIVFVSPVAPLKSSPPRAHQCCDRAQWRSPGISHHTYLPAPSPLKAWNYIKTGFLSCKTWRMNHPGLDHIGLVGHQDDWLLPELQLADLLKDGVRNSHGALVVNSTDNYEPLWVVKRDQPFQLIQNIILSHSQTISFTVYRDLSIGMIHE